MKYGIEEAIMELDDKHKDSFRLYDATRRLVDEINKVIDHTPYGDCVIDCDCSGIELAKVEAEEALEAAGGKDEAK